MGPLMGSQKGLLELIRAEKDSLALMVQCDAQLILTRLTVGFKRTVLNGFVG